MLVMIANPTAGCGHGKVVAGQVEEALKKAGLPYTARFTEAPGHGMLLAREAAADPACEGVLAVGGDGTAHEVAAGLMDSGKPMGIIPAGTGNDFIRSLNYPKDTDEVIARVLKREVHPVDMIRVNDRCSLNVSGTGFDVTVLKETERYHGKLKGMLPYLLGLLRGIGLYRPVHVKLDIDGKQREQDVLICAIANGRYFGGGIPICPEAKVDDGLLDLVLVRNIPRWRVPFYLPGLLFGRVLKFGITEHIRCRSITIRGNREMDVQTDGEIHQMKEAAMRVEPGRLLLYR